MKKKLLFLMFLPLLLTGVVTGQGLLYLPDYYSQSDFLPTSPGVSGDAAGAFFNPAVWGMVKGPELQFYWSDLDREPWETKNWAGVMGSKGLGFGMQNWTYGELVGGEWKERSLTDYNIALGGGDDEMSFGLGYTWSKGDISPRMARENTLSLGTLNRPCRYFSLGTAGHYGLKHKDFRGVVDVGLRPLGTPMLTLFADGSMFDSQRLEDAAWAVGAAVEPVPGITVFAKKFGESEGFNVGLALSLGSIGFSSSSHMDKDGANVYRTHGIRLGYPRKNIVTPNTCKNKMMVKMDFDSRLKYRRYRFFDWEDRTLMETLKALEDVKNDERAAGIALRITEDMGGNWALMWEVREKIKELQNSGKKVYVFLERGGMKQYYLASVGDKIMVDPESMVILPGFVLGRTYYRGMTDKLGLGVDEWRYFKYKSAFESFSRKDMSEADREQRKALCDGWYETFRKDICRSRGMTHEEFDTIVNKFPLLSADSLLQREMADTVGRWCDMEDYIKETLGKKRLVGEKPFAAMIPQEDEWGIPPQIAVIYALGECSMNTGIHAKRLKNVIKCARENKKVKAVVLRADSPGGDVLPSDIVAVELKKTAEKKPVIVSQGYVAASGGYWISMYGDKILATPMTVTGSIGVIGGFLYDDGFGDKIGFTYDHTKTGEHADIFRGMRMPFLGFEIPDRNLTDEEREYVGRFIKQLYRGFVERVAESRKMKVEAVEEVAQGRVWIGPTGKEIGLIDEVGGMEKAVAMAREAAGIKSRRKIQIVEMPERGLFNPNMFQPSLLGYRETLFPQGVDSPELNYYRMLLKAEGRPLLMVPPELYLTD